MKDYDKKYGGALTEGKGGGEKEGPYGLPPGHEPESRKCG